MMTIAPKSLDAVDQDLLCAVIDALDGQAQAISIRALCERLAAGGRLPPLPREAQLYPNHPIRQAVGDVVLALHGADELAPLMARKSLREGELGHGKAAEG